MMIFPHFINHFQTSIQFLSRLPPFLYGYRYSNDNTAPDFSQSAYTFPLAGFIIALPCAIVLWLTAEVLTLPPLVCSLCTLSILILSTGALHEDGLADVADGFWGGYKKQRKLEIMRDSAIGTYGVLALILSIALRVVFVATFIQTYNGFITALIILACASLSRMAMLQPWIFLPSARANTQTKSPAPEDKDKHGKIKEGLSARYGVPTTKSLVYAIGASLPAFFLLIMIVGFFPTIMALLIFQTTILAMIFLYHKHIQGHTGDTLGATQQISEIGLYFTLATFI